MVESRIGCRISKIDAYELKILRTKEPLSSFTLVLGKNLRHNVAIIEIKNSFFS